VREVEEFFVRCGGAGEGVATALEQEGSVTISVFSSTPRQDRRG
jgi:shikimate 5-dehydrogenase